ncbi:hypothetical protein PHJA_002873000 [Phtheirospermum japonicum]|uniref:Uncharacterized protein n=1 Tax=Phtheirospermum japonicum TaxID=374723 RepID=A0A830DC40_9LAMI|nr:hypothetical protein PHJA_002873000 [Phtheirospermum japonicum]
MHSGFEIPGIQQHQQAAATEHNSYAPVLLSMNQTHILDQIHTLPATQQRLFLDQPHFLPPQTRLSHPYVGGASSSAYFPAVNFKLGLNNEICARNNDYTNKDGSNIDELRGSERYEVPDVRQSSLGMLHCWQNQQDSANKQPPPLWEHLTISEVSNENSEIVDVRSQEHLEMNNPKQVPADDHHHLTTCLDSKNRLHFGELEAIYKRLGTTESNQTGPCESNLPMNPAHLPEGFDHGSEPEEASAPPPKSNDTNRKRKKKSKKENSYSRCLISPTAEFFGNLVQQVMDHQENMHKKFAQVIERLEEERKAREEDWRKQELERFEQESEARAKEKASAKDREAIIVSYLEKITGERIRFADFDPMEIVPTNTSND